MYVPHLFIGIGETNAFFTLRQTDIKYIPGAGDMGNAVVNGVYQGTEVVTSFHIVNLSQDPTEAWAKAKEHAQRMGLELRGNPDKLADERRDIIRLNAEQVAARTEQERVDQEARDAHRAEMLAVWLKSAREILEQGRVPTGKFAGIAIKDVNRSYLTWVASTTFEPDNYMSIFAEVIKASYSHLLLAQPDKHLHFGTVGARMECDVDVLRTMKFDTQFGTTYLVSMRDKATGACLVAMTGTFNAEAGEALRIKFTIKAHDEYKGQAQTKVFRVKRIEEKAA